MFIFSYVKDLASYQNVLFCVTRVSCFHTHPANLSVNLYISKFASFHALCPIFLPNMHNWSMWTGLWVYCVMNIRLCWQHIKTSLFQKSEGNPVFPVMSPLRNTYSPEILITLIWLDSNIENVKMRSITDAMCISFPPEFITRRAPFTQVFNYDIGCRGIYLYVSGGVCVCVCVCVHACITSFSSTEVIIFWWLCCQLDHH